MTTKDIENTIYKHLKKKGNYMVFECAVPRSYQNKYHRERVDLLSYDTKGNWRFYELKNSVSDFHSKSSHTFLGHYNYYVMPEKVYSKVKEEIPKHVGVWVIYSYNSNKFFASCEQKPKKQQLKVKHEDLMFSFMQALYREYTKFRRIKNA